MSTKGTDISHCVPRTSSVHAGSSTLAEAADLDRRLDGQREHLSDANRRAKNRHKMCVETAKSDV